jgi:hypothetical protein
MRTLPTMMIRLLAPFAPLFSRRVWHNAEVLLTGAFPQPRADEQSVRPCVRWAWTSTSGSTVTTAFSAALAGRAAKRAASYWDCS